MENTARYCPVCGNGSDYQEDMEMTPDKQTFLRIDPDGSVIDWGRHATVNGVRGNGGARIYRGEAAEVMKLVLKYMGQK